MKPIFWRSCFTAAFRQSSQLMFYPIRLNQFLTSNYSNGVRGRTGKALEGIIQNYHLLNVRGKEQKISNGPEFDFRSIEYLPCRATLPGGPRWSLYAFRPRTRHSGEERVSERGRTYLRTVADWPSEAGLYHRDIWLSRLWFSTNRSDFITSIGITHRWNHAS